MGGETIAPQKNSEILGFWIMQIIHASHGTLKVTCMHLSEQACCLTKRSDTRGTYLTHVCEPQAKLRIMYHANAWRASCNSKWANSTV